MKPTTLHAVVFRGIKHYVAQCLEVNIAAQAKRLEDLPKSLSHNIRAEIEMSREEGVEPFSKLREAPEKYWAMWHGAEPVQDTRPWQDVPVEIVASIAKKKPLLPSV